MYINKSKISDGVAYLSYRYRCDCNPSVSLPSIKGPLYWKPPSFIPSIYKAKALGNTKTPITNILYQSTIDHCMKKFMFIWFKNGTEFWSVPIMAKNNNIYLWIWEKFNWQYYIVPLENIDCFICY